MTRITDFGRKRTYIEAGFASEPLNSEPTPAPAAAPSAPGPATEDTAEKPAKKKRKRTPKSKRDNYGKDKPAAASTDDAAPENATAPADTPDGTSTPPPDGLSKRKLWKKEKAKQWREKTAEAKRVLSETRRQKRVNIREIHMTCLACRESGHKARDCPNTKTDGSHKPSVGICYRCGSKRHSLSKCKSAVDPDNPLPFASCFVCNGTGHLASGCPQNADKGIYPNGGGCKLCGKNTHLAKDCDLRKGGTAEQGSIFLGAAEAGADEDDFHILRRKQGTASKDEQKSTDISGPRPQAAPPMGAAKKVVHF